MTNKQRLDLNKLLPSSLKNETISGITANLFNRFVSEEQSVLVAGRIGTDSTINEAQITDPDLYRQLNAIVPAFYTKAGTQETVNDFADMLNRFNALGVDVDNMKSWLAEQNFNFAPPINIDAFVNFANYYWVGKITPTSGLVPNWNPDAAVENVVIARPSVSSTAKMSVRFATTRPIKLHGADRVNNGDTETFTIVFTSANTFTISASEGPINVRTAVGGVATPAAGGVFTAPITLPNNTSGAVNRIYISAPDTTPSSGFGLGDDDANDEPLLNFSITLGSTAFAVGDSFVVVAKYFTSQHTVSFTTVEANPLNRGTLDQIETTTPLMFIDGEVSGRVKVNDRILVWNQTDPAQNGIYRAAHGHWSRTVDANQSSHLPVGAKVYVADGSTYGNKVFEIMSKTAVGTPVGDDLSHETVWGVSTDTINPVNDWQLFNYWYHVDELPTLGISVNNPDLIRATRPIIEFPAGLQLNTHVDDGVPSDAGTFYTQRKALINQLPQFNLYRYDGTHAKKTSTIFHFTEDADFPIDPVLQKRAKTSANADFIFSTSISDEAGRLLFYKNDGELTTVWTAGADAATVGSISFTGGLNKGVLTITNVREDAENETWAITALTSNTFRISGTRHGVLPLDAVADTAYDAGDFTVTVNSGVSPFIAGEFFTFNMHNKVSPRYVKQVDGEVTNFVGGPAQDKIDNDTISGAWLTPVRMFQNVERTFSQDIGYADLIGHFRSIIKTQDGFTGTSLGKNNFRNLSQQLGYGGKIREFGSNFPLLVSMLMQQELSSISLLDFAEQQYNVAISSVDQFMAVDLIEFITHNSAVVQNNIDPFSVEIQKLLVYFEWLRGENTHLTQVYGDSSMGVKNWPITLPVIGAVRPVPPTITFDQQLGIDVIVHHDGHKSALARDDLETKRLLVRTVVSRSDGSMSPGIFATTVPASPYARQVWMNSNTQQLFVFDVAYDSTIMPGAGQSGDFWYKRSANMMYEWDDMGSAWLPSSETVADRWLSFDVAAIRNSLILAVEEKLYYSVHPAQALLPLPFDVSAVEVDPNASDELEIELARYAAKYGYDTYGTDYSAIDAFTWNYSQTDFSAYPSIVSPFGNARWFDIYARYFDQPGLTYPTSRPNLEPWLLLAEPVKPSWWDTTYASQISTPSVSTVPSVRVVSTVDIGIPIGLLTVDGVSLSVGDRVLFAAQAVPAQNGTWIASNGAWSRSADALATGTVVAIQEGAARINSQWIVTTTGPITIGTSPIAFSQIRLWSDQMWTDIKAARPGLKLCVNPYTDELLPPYVAPSQIASVEALVNIIPPGIDASYSFGDNGPIETVWKKSSEYKYGLARVSFKLNPLRFLDSLWGETYVQANDKNGTSGPNGIRIERNLANVLPHTKFQLHGERLHVDSSLVHNAEEYISYTAVTNSGHAGVVRFEVTYVADNKTYIYVYVNNIVVDMVEVGQTFSLPLTDGISITDCVISDMGIPFSIGTAISLTFSADIVTITSGSLVCTGCVADGEVPVQETIITPGAPVKLSIYVPSVKRLIGFGQTFTNMLRSVDVDTEYSTAINLFRKWEARLIHRLGALVRPDTLKVDTTLGLLPSTSYSAFIKRSTHVSSRWISALRVQLVEMGQRELTPQGLYIPSNDGSDWKFRVEVYNPQHPTIDYYALDVNGDFQTFTALNEESTPLAWKRYTGRTALITNYTMPQVITGLQNVATLIYGYIDRLAEVGFRIDATGDIVIDDETGRNIDWQLGVEKLIDRVYSGMSAGQGVILNPFMEVLWVDTPSGLLSHFTNSSFNDIYTTQAAYDVTGTVLPLNQLYVARGDDATSIRTQTPIFSAHVFNDEFEHIILFNDKVIESDDSAAIFIPFLGQAISSAYLTFVRQAEVNRKPAFNGFFLSGNDLKRNIVGSVDQIGKYYDAYQTFDDAPSSQHALALLGYTQKDYLSSISTTDAAQFNFWRGLIQAKGTNMTVDAFVNYRKFNDASTDEYWAYKLATYGDSREKSSPEIKVNSSDVSQRFSQFQFYDAQVGLDAIPLYTAIENDDDTRWVGIDDLGKGLSFNTAPISETLVAPTAGYYRLNHIFHNGDNTQPSVTPSVGAQIINASLIKVITPGTYTISGITWINPSKHSPIKLFDYENSVLVKEIGLWHPAIGIHAIGPLESVDTIAKYDPAQYNESLQKDGNPNYRLLRPWGSNEVGRTWWNTSNLGYIPYYDAKIFPSRIDRQERWGLLAEWASVDLFEWVESTVPPEEYNDLSLAQEGRIDIPVKVRASGQVAARQIYARDRQLSIRPIAWSKAGVGGTNAHPAFGPAEFTKVYNASGALFADSGRTASVNLIAGRRFGGWIAGTPALFIADKPLGEVIIGDDLVYNIGSSENLSSPAIIQPVSVDIAVVDAGSTLFGSRIGNISVAVVGDGTILRMQDDDNFYQDLQMLPWNATVGEIRNLEFADFGIVLALTSKVTSVLSASIIAQHVADAIDDLYIREGAVYTTIIDLPITGVFDNSIDQEVLVNDNGTPLDTSDDILGTPIITSDIAMQWRTWSVPTQQQLNADLSAPKNVWKPYVGDMITISPTPEIIEELNSAETDLTMRNGTVISRYDSQWSNWELLKEARVEKVSNGVDQVVFTKEDMGIFEDEIDLNRLLVFTDGSQLSPNVEYGYRIGYDPVQNTEVAQVVNILDEGTTVLMIYRPVQPTSDDLSFNPDVEDDFDKQIQYKADYQHSKLEIRDEFGNVTSAKYYFWVKNKLTRMDNKMSIATAKQILSEGQQEFMLLSRAKSQVGFDSCAIAGLNRYVTKNDTFKIRFARNFTLRDDPENLDLKNTHTEWTLMRAGQQAKIPKTLWDRLTDAVAGEDIGGNSLPSQIRIDYDARNGTNSKYGFEPGQIFAETQLVRESIINAIKNTRVVLRVGAKTITDFITFLDFNNSDMWFVDASTARSTMNSIWARARPKQINEIFFASLNDALANNYEFSDIFKTSYITVNSSTVQQQALTTEIEDGIF